MGDTQLFHLREQAGHQKAQLRMAEEDRDAAQLDALKRFAKQLVGGVVKGCLALFEELTPRLRGAML